MPIIIFKTALEEFSAIVSISPLKAASDEMSRGTTINKTGIDKAIPSKILPMPFFLMISAENRESMVLGTKERLFEKLEPTSLKMPKSPSGALFATSALKNTKESNITATKLQNLTSPFEVIENETGSITAKIPQTEGNIPVLKFLLCR